MANILIIDDEAGIRRSLKEILEFENHTVFTAENGKEGLSLLAKENLDLCFCDIKMQGMDGLEVLTQARQDSDIPFIMISGHGTIETAVEALQIGAVDFIEKPFDLNRVMVAIKNALKLKKLEKKEKELKRRIKKKTSTQIIGESKGIKEVKALIEKVAPTDARVLITGENGTGKELVARQIHELSTRAAEPFIEVNCAAIPSELIESELFGHEKGSFTSAIKQKKGLFELAHGGTIFLDEIGDMALSAQAKVLRALQENKITRVGGDKDIKINVRVIAATNKDLREEINKGGFREDLFHRLAVILMHIPSLNDRKDDIGLLSNFFLDQICADYGMPKKAISKDAIKSLEDLNWTGNIRELRNTIERLIILSDSEISAQDVSKYQNPQLN
ncbi:sigma-54-dependent transcriptional regulator [Luteibaculum oceani]|uniref:Sigma-54-dependent Fis family transcriptional regulator n=1 Tax=Luteibaculum oceani TaxID=1294296 RepID=A0A5C6UYM2_9FLAO|nr:sigma-54 dependent transcriptional regulator [Luteibaculum oceani]TXC78397.1 sigma-54-dependent Fis family transcriptional regulator [Luteibaculum oceani]